MLKAGVVERETSKCYRYDIALSAGGRADRWGGAVLLRQLARPHEGRHEEAVVPVTVVWKLDQVKRLERVKLSARLTSESV